MRASCLVALCIVCSTPAAFAAGGIEITRGDDTMVFGSCVPSLLVTNKSPETIDYLQVDVAMTLGDGQVRVVELASAYREGIHYPIEADGTAILRQHLDTSQALGAPCGEIKARKVEHVVCEVARGKACPSPVSARP